MIVSWPSPDAYGQRFAALIDRLPSGCRRRPEVAAPAPANISGALGAPVLIARDLVKNFGGPVAANNVSLTLHRGEILGVIGPNGAGKTTMFGLLSGFQKQNAGTVEVVDKNGIGRFPDRPDSFARLGVGRTFQIVQHFGKLSVLENIMIAKVKPRGCAKVEAVFTFAVAAYNLIRIPKLMATTAA